MAGPRYPSKNVVKHNSRKAACEGKVGFDTFDAANALVKRIKASRRKGRYSPYRCTYCRKWHMGGGKWE